MNMRPQTHVCLVSAQPTPNLTPALDPAFRPRRVILLVSPDMKQRAEWLAAVLKGVGIQVDFWPIDDAWNIEAIQIRVLELLEREEGKISGREIALNATGGTKPMSIAAYESFRGYDLPIFYVHPEEDRLIWMHPSTEESTALADRVKLEAFLQAHGVALEGRPKRNVPDHGRLALAKEVVEALERFSRVLPAFNWLAAGAEKKLVSEPVKHDQGELAQLIDLFEDAGVLRRDQGRLRFSDEESRFFAAGGWLEMYVFDSVRQLRKTRTDIQDVAYSIPVVREQRGKRVPNELDVVFLCNNRLHIIECKTRRFRGDGEDDDASQALYKLDTLRDLMGGLQAKAMLVSYQDLNGHDRTRAADLNIAVCAGLQLRNLGKGLKALVS